MVVLGTQLGTVWSADQGIKCLLEQGQESSPLTNGAHLDRWVRYPYLYY